jgi:hypothetical protein
VAELILFGSFIFTVIAGLLAVTLAYFFLR